MNCLNVAIRHSHRLLALSSGHHGLRYKSSFQSAPIQASVTDDGKTIVCWHPEQPFPYEHTKPLPVVEPKFMEEDSVIKVQLREEMESVMAKRDLTEEDLMRLAYNSRSTFKHYQNKERRTRHIRKPNPEIDRIGI